MRIRYTSDWDADKEAMIDSRAINRLRFTHGLSTPATKAKAKRGTVRGSIGARQRRGLVAVPTVTHS